MRRAGWLLAVLAATGCSLRDTRVRRDVRPGGIFDTPAEEVYAPAKDRCVALGQSGVRRQCEEAKNLAQTYVRRLSTTDEVCLEGGFGEVPGAACLARAFVADTQTDKVLLEIREAKPESRWFNYIQYQIWFAEGALVDLYLADRGY